MTRTATITLHPAIQWVPAPPRARAAAAILDAVVAACIAALVVFVTLLVLSGPAAVPLRTDSPVGALPAAYLRGFALEAALVAIAYLPLCWWRWGQTVGMAAFGLHVVRVDDAGPLGLRQALVRLVVLVVGVVAVGLGLLSIVRHPERRGWHDRAAGTLVVRRAG
jgi:uncharacterized RDD family membrane protein YckC